MSLLSHINDKTTRDRFKAITPDASMFQVDPASASAHVPAFLKCDCLVPADDFTGGRAGRVGAAFDYLVRAQVAKWSNEVPDASMRWVATSGLFGVNVSMKEFVPFDMAGPVWLGPKCLDFLANGGDRTPVARIFERYHTACLTWEKFVGGSDNLDDALIDATWLLAGLEGVFRSGGRGLVDPSAIAGAPDPASRKSLNSLWEVLKTQRSFFSGSRTRVYNPTFGLASRLVQGADADLVLDDTLIEIKATASAGYTVTPRTSAHRPPPLHKRHFAGSTKPSTRWPPSAPSSAAAVPPAD